MLVFVVPIKSKQVSSNWGVFTLLIERTMRSICQQSSPNFKIVAACHEIPNINFSHPSLEFIQVDFEPPTPENIKKYQGDDNYRNGAKEADKAKKLMAGIEYGKKYNPSHFMVADADDCIHRDLVRFLEKDQNKTLGWYFKKGYIYNEGSNLIFLNKNTFNILCGTCIVIKADYINLLFQNTPQPLYNHDFMELEGGKRLTPLPFAGAVYSIGNTENYCSTPEAVKKMNSYNFLTVDFYENIIRKLAKYSVRPVTRSFREKFGLYKLDFSTVFT